jgi:hypothetical protein
VLIVGKASIDNSCPKFLVLAKAVKTACRTLLIASILLNLLTVVFSKSVSSDQTASKSNVFLELAFSFADKNAFT